MDVYFGRNFWCGPGEQNEEQPGLCLKSGAEFHYGGFLWRVPAVYVCRDGIVLDICRRVPKDAVQRFWDVWGKWQGREEEMSPARQRQVKRENPFFFQADFKLEVDGRTWARCGSSMLCIEPIGMRDGSVGEEACRDGTGQESQGRRERCKGQEKRVGNRAANWPKDEIGAEYRLDRQDGWQVFRCSFRNEDDQAAAGEGENGAAPGDFRLTVAAREVRLSCGCSFVTRAGCGKRAEHFFHPVTGQMMELAVLGCREYNMEAEEHMFREKWKGYSLPGHGCVVEYVLRPKLPPGEYLTVRDCCQGDGPVAVNGVDGCGRTAKIAVIGGCDGPTSVFAAGKVKQEHEDTGSSYGYSSLYFEPIKEVRWEAELCAVPFGPETFELRAERAEDDGEKGQDQLLSGPGGCGGKKRDLPAQALRGGDREK